MKKHSISLELFHRIRFKSKEAISSGKQKLYEKLFQGVKSGDVSSWLKSFLNKERDIHFSERLKQLFEEIDNSKKLELNYEFIKRVVKTRNYYVHLDDSLETDIFNFDELIDANNKLSALMMAAFNWELIKP
ncbi:MAG TPA: HEPN domain-containing protein [Chitinophagaceae bacterium]|nr:HEPN domain-containing protein [Chitinophagaceae bacterium]